MRKLNVMLGGALLGVFGFAGNALAAAGDPPTFDVTDLTPSLNDFGTAMLVGVSALIGVTLVIRAPFALIRVALSAVRRLFGRSTPSAT